MLPRIVTRVEARATGLVRYFSGRKCPHGHVCERYVSSGGCVECLRGREKSYRAPRPLTAAERRQYNARRRARWAADPEGHRAQQRHYRASRA